MDVTPCVAFVCSAGAGRRPPLLGHPNRLTTLTLANLMKFFSCVMLSLRRSGVLGLNEGLICITKTLALPPIPKPPDPLFGQTVSSGAKNLLFKNFFCNRGPHTGDHVKLVIGPTTVEIWFYGRKPKLFRRRGYPAKFWKEAHLGQIP